ncbi:putative short-chain dehydrogenase/oxidoreductase, partial [Aspergillus sclerotioniger CBS 115572]
VLIIGATSSIGRALMMNFVENGANVVMAGRKENLDEFVRKEIWEINEINYETKYTDPSFATEITTHPDLDFLFINSGVQRMFDLSKPPSIDLDILDTELLMNYTSNVHLTHAILPHLWNKFTQTAIAYTTSQMPLVPMIGCPKYRVSKAGLYQFILGLRTRVAAGSERVKVVEVYPPAVQRELRGAQHHADLKDGHLVGMPLGEFVDKVWERLRSGEEQIAVGSAGGIYNVFEVKMQELYRDMTEVSTGLLKVFLR